MEEEKTPRVKLTNTVKGAVASVGAARWGLIAFCLGLASSSILSITSITNAMSGHDKIMESINPYFSTFPFLVLFFCIAFSMAVPRLDTAIRKTAIFMFVGVAFIFSILTLHLSTYTVTSSL